MEGDKNRSILGYVQHAHRHSLRHLKLWFIPHTSNNHQPHALRPNALKIYCLILIGVKIIASSVLFIAYPSPAQFAALTTQNMINLTNQSRIDAGLGALKLDTKLQKAAENKAKDMIAKGYFAHTSPSGVRFFTWIKNAGYSYSTAGENLAMDFTSAENTHAALMNSKSHKENILNKKYTQVGMAVMSGKIEGSDTVILVEMFGAPIKAKTTTTAQKPAATTKPTTTKPTTTQPTKPTTTTPTKPATEPTSPVKSDVVEIPETFTSTIDSQSVNTVESVAGNSLTFSVKATNTGTGSWSAKTKLEPDEKTANLLSSAGNQTFMPVDKLILPGESVILSAAITLPKDAGTYDLAFNIKDEEKIIENSIISISSVLTDQVSLPIAHNQTIEKSTASEEELTLAKNTQIAAFSPVVTKNQGFIAKFIEITQKFLFAFLLFLVITLLLNIFINIKVQHGHVIVQSMIVIILATATLLVRINFLENIGGNLKIL